MQSRKLRVIVGHLIDLALPSLKIQIGEHHVGGGWAFCVSRSVLLDDDDDDDYISFCDLKRQRLRNTYMMFSPTPSLSIREEKSLLRSSDNELAHGLLESSEWWKPTLPCSHIQ
jgi:hypothetical protein